MFKRIGNFLSEVKIELGKVSWSTKEELISSTWIVIVVVFLLAVFVGIVDLFLSKMVGLFIR